ncbi:uncharacterized protein EV154DRAFT_554560 [Mucor mucedo]|uniref:uncharacterized protein n=1 Tax=Mucor mucedo TaxID=29922 RepID=UPI002220C5D0|nr:uncharacterized protein EV154DRAFT_554560 [Mucor mucedo]KAI7887276.1 hypothetical protein EV154DRAFT_554560 [Mucor mucedo]
MASTMLLLKLQSLEVDRRIKEHEAILNSLVQKLPKGLPRKETIRKRSGTSTMPNISIPSIPPITSGPLSAGSVGWTKDITTFAQLWEEYSVGYNGKPSIQSLYANVPHWVPREKRSFHYSRMHAIRLINNCARAHKISK